VIVKFVFSGAFATTSVLSGMGTGLRAGILKRLLLSMTSQIDTIKNRDRTKSPANAMKTCLRVTRE
jgi:hypothetical protein